MRTKLVSFTTKDKLRLPGILYEPRRKTRKAALFLHGNGSSSVFYNDAFNDTLPQTLVRQNIAYLPFNNRGAHYIKSFSYKTKGKKVRALYGMTYERIKECIKDIDAAIAFLRTCGYREFYLIGHSTGANKVCVYNYYKKRNPIRKYVLLGAGDDTGIYYRGLGKRRFNHLLKKSSKLARSKRRNELTHAITYAPFSWQALYDTLNPDGDYNIFPFNEYFSRLGVSRKKLFREFSSIKKPTLVVYGEQDKYLTQPAQHIVDTLKKHAENPELFYFQIIRNTNHGFSGTEKQLSKTIASFLHTTGTS